EVKGRVIEPRKYKTPGAFVVDTGGGRVRQFTLGPLSLPDPAGVEEHGQWPTGFPGNLRDPDVSIVNPDGRPEPTTPWPPVGRPRPRGANHGRHAGIGSRRHRTGRDGRRGVGASHSIAEAGEPSRGTPWREGDAMSCHRRRETWRWHRNP